MDRKTIRPNIIAEPAFYRRILAVAGPIMIQNAITNVVGMLDNVMVGRIGTDAMNGVSIVNQLLFVYYLCIFGGTAGIGIFTAQFYGKNDHKGIQYTLRAKVLLGVILTALSAAVLAVSGGGLIGLFLHEGGSAGDIRATMSNGLDYLYIMLIGLLPMTMASVYGSTLRETGNTVIPMRAGITAVIVNLIGNYILIYGNFGAPRLGVAGAAAATVISRFVEMAFIMIWIHLHADKNPFIRGCFKSLYIPADLLKQFIIKGLPLLINETLWSMGMTMLTQCYSLRGLTAVAALNIAHTLVNVLSIVFLSMGDATSILLGQELGAGRTEGVKQYAWRLAAFSVFLSIISCVVMLAISPFFPSVYNTSEEVKSIARSLIMVSAFCMPIQSFYNSVYFTLRSGGKTWLTFLFDSVYLWAVPVAAAFLLSHLTDMPLIYMYLIVQLMDLIKCILGFVLVKRGRWIHDLTAYTEKA